MHSLHSSAEAIWAHVDVIYAPGQSKSAKFNLLLAVPITELGNYTLKYYYSSNPGGGDETWTPITSTSFEVTPLPHVPPNTSAAIVELTENVLGLRAFDLVFSGDVILETGIVLRTPDLPAHAAEYVRYLEGLYADLHRTFVDESGPDASQIYANFLADYPQTVYKLAVEQGSGGLFFFGGTIPYTEQANSYR